MSSQAEAHAGRPGACRPHVQAIIKLGGAAITAKPQLEAPELDLIALVAQHIKEVYDNSSQQGGVVVVHGAGSYGHPQAAAHRVAHGPLDDPHVRHGFTVTRASVLKLNSIVVDALIAAGVPAVGLPALGTWVCDNRKVVQDGVAGVAACLAAGLVPVLHGDAVLDTHTGCTVLSGDVILSVLARALCPRRAVFLTNVCGVYDRPPEQAGARLVRAVAVEADGSWCMEDVATNVSDTDTTGGMAKKIEEAAAVAAGGVDVIIAQAGTEWGRVACLQPPLHLLGNPGWQGTVVHGRRHPVVPPGGVGDQRGSEGV